jgi:hypothetical protein
VDTETRRKRQQALMRRMAERKLRSRAQELYESRGQTDGHELQDWFQAESEMLNDNRLAPLYRHLRDSGQDAEESPEQTGEKAVPCETGT